MKTGDVLILAGKGHETGQYVDSEVYPFSDREQAVAAATALGGRAA
jgi:UDP-N-acetylmuramoyl-L-alanyl-D-glutamate--2,6-diaminopimelate ligase